MTTEGSTLDCARAREQVSACHDGEAARDAALVEHLAACSACREFEAGCAEVSAAFAPLREGAPAADLGERLLANNRARDRAPRLVPLPSPWLRVAAGLVGMASIGGLGALVEARAHGAPAEATASTVNSASWLEPLAGRALHPSDAALHAWSDALVAARVGASGTNRNESSEGRR
jgi:predicted anti-sigma-YlaC factor YlaD